MTTSSAAGKGKDDKYVKHNHILENLNIRLFPSYVITGSFKAKRHIFSKYILFCIHYLCLKDSLQEHSKLILNRHQLEFVARHLGVPMRHTESSYGKE